MSHSYFQLGRVLPAVAKAIEEFGTRSDDYMAHEAIVEFLLQDSEGASLIAWASSRAKLERDSRSQAWTAKQWAANMVAWFSAKYTKRELPQIWLDRFERRGQADGNWQYRMRHRYGGEGRAVQVAKDGPPEETTPNPATGHS